MQPLNQGNESCWSELQPSILHLLFRPPHPTRSGGDSVESSMYAWKRASSSQPLSRLSGTLLCAQTYRAGLLRPAAAATQHIRSPAPPPQQPTTCGLVLPFYWSCFVAQVGLELVAPFSSGLRCVRDMSPRAYVVLFYINRVLTGQAYEPDSFLRRWRDFTVSSPNGWSHHQVGL